MRNVLCSLDGCVCSDWWVHVTYIHVVSYIMLTRVILKVIHTNSYKVNMLSAAVHVITKCCDEITIVAIYITTNCGMAVAMYIARQSSLW